MVHVKGSPLIGKRGYWLSLPILLLVSATLALFSWKEPLLGIFADWYRFTSESLELHGVLALTAPVLIFLLLVLLARLELDAGGGASHGRELDWLLQRKRTRSWLLNANKIWDQITPRRHDPLTNVRAIQVFQSPGSPSAKGLDRLVQEKRSGAWSLLSPDSLPDPSGEHGLEEV